MYENDVLVRWTVAWYAAKKRPLSQSTNKCYSTVTIFGFFGEGKGKTQL
jgi:hypothetical protein